MRIDFVAPPFAGHLFPILEMASFLRRKGWTELRVLSTADAADSIRLQGLTPVPLLSGLEDRVWAIANPGRRVGSNPFRLYRQFQMNMALMGKLQEQLRALWAADRPRLVIADFTIPVAGLLARTMQIPWWTSMPSPCALETRTGVPSYLGGWRPRNDRLGRLRDAAGRRVIRWFKLGVGAVFARELRAFSAPGVYREDGGEAAYSPECILALGMSEFELERDWPSALHFIGPLTASPPYPHTPPEFPHGKPCILISLGTHLHWARDSVTSFVESLARAMPDCLFHFALGKTGSTALERRGNLHLHDFVPYDSYLHRYNAAMIHGGTGIVYSCIKAGVPMLVWPQDFDHFDHAARIVERGLGLLLTPRRGDVVLALRRLLNDETLRARVTDFQALARKYDAGAWVCNAVQGLDKADNKPGPQAEEGAA